MSRLILPTRFYQQPTAITSISPTNVGLINPFVAVNFNDLSGYDCVSGQLGVRTGTITPDIRFPGIGAKSTNATTSRYNYGSQPTTTKFTGCAVFIVDAAANNNLICTSTTNSGWRFEYGGSGPGIRIAKGGVASLPAVATSVGIPYACVASHDQASGDYYILLKNLNTGAITVNTATNTTVSTANTGTLGVCGGRQNDGSFSWGGTVFMAVGAFEYLPRSLGEAWLQNPWAIFQPPHNLIWSSSAPAPSQDLTPSLYTDIDSFYAPTVVRETITCSEPVAEIASTANSTTYAFGAFTPASDATLVMMVFTSGTVLASPTVTGGLTWTLETSVTYNTDQTGYLFWANTGTDPGSLTFTFDCTGDGATGCVASIFEFKGSDVNRANPIKQKKTSATTAANPTVTMDAALDTNNGYCAGFGVPRNPPVSTPPTDWTEIADTGVGGPTQGATFAFRAKGETGTVITFTSDSAAYGMIVAEVYAADTTVVLAPSLYVDSDSFYTPTVSVGAVTLTPGLYTDTDVFYTPVTLNQNTLAPSLYVDSDAFYAPTVAPGTITLTPSLYSDADAFHSPTVTVGTVTLTPGIYADVDTFYTQTIAQSITLTPSLYSDVDAFYVPTVAAGTITLTPDVYVDTDAFYMPTVAAGVVTLTPDLYIDTDVLYTPSVAANNLLTPSLYDDTDSFHTLMVTRGTITLTPSLYVDSDAFYIPTVSQGNVVLEPDLYVDDDLFYTPIIAAGAVTLVPGLYTDVDAFYSPSVAANNLLTPSLYSDVDAFYSPTVSPGTITLTPDLYSDTDSIYTPVVSQGGTALEPDLYADADTFYAPTVSRGVIILEPGLYVDIDAFYAPTVSRGIVTLVPDLFTNDSVFSTASVSSNYGLTPGLYQQTNSFYDGTVTTTYVISPGLYSNPDVFYSPSVIGGVHPITAPLFVNQSDFYGHTITGGASLQGFGGFGVFPSPLPVEREFVPYIPPPIFGTCSSRKALIASSFGIAVSYGFIGNGWSSVKPSLVGNLEVSVTAAVFSKVEASSYAEGTDPEMDEFILMCMAD